MFSVFLSHSTRDLDFATKLSGDLQRNGIDVWMHELEILVGDSIPERIEEGLRGASLVIVLLSIDSINSAWVRRVLWATTSLNGKSGRFDVLIAKKDDCEAPLLIGDRKSANFFTSYDDGLRELIDAIRARSRFGPPSVEVERNRKSTEVATTISTRGIELTLPDEDLSSYSVEKQSRLIKAIENLLEIDELRITKKRSGSVILSFELTPEKAEQLYWAVKSGKLEHLGVSDATLLEMASEDHSEQWAALYASEDAGMAVRVGEIVKGTVIEVRPREVLVDIGYKSEGVISASEFDDIKVVKVGDSVDVLIEKLEDKEGMVVLSKEKAEFKKNWDKILTICNKGGTIAGKVKAVVKGGLLVNIGVEAFLPASQIDIVPPKNLNALIGNTYDFKVVKIDQERQNIVLSRRELIEQERNERRSKLLAEMAPGDIRKGTVKNITDFGAFIDLNGLDGLLHITDMSWGRIGHPSEILKVGQDIDVVVLDINKEKERVSLGLKQKLANPWDQIASNYSIGARVKGKVVNLVPYGAFVELEPGVEGFVHVTELSWTKRIAKPSDVLKPEQEIEAVVLGINREEQRISLGVRQLETNPWDEALEKYPPGSKVKGKIRNLTSYGAFIELEDGLDGMIHVSDISWTRKINHPSEVLKKGEEVEAVVLEIDKANQRISLGVKQLSEDPWNNIDKYYKVGDLVTGKVTKLASFGAFIGLQHDIDGLVHISQVSEERVDKIKNVLKVDQEVTARVIKIDKGERRIGLSIKAANYSQEQLKAEQAMLDSLKPGEDLVALQHAFDAADQEKQP